MTELNKKIFLQYKEESALSIPVEESSESVVVTPPPSRSITNDLLNRTGSYTQLKQRSLLLHRFLENSKMVLLISLCDENLA